MASDANCVFCKIIDGKIPSKKLLETEKSYAFLGALQTDKTLDLARRVTAL